MNRPLWTPLHARLHRTIYQRDLLRKNQSVLVAVSGGQDSICLIKLLVDVQRKWNWNLAIAHCNHRWRSDSDQNAEFVAALSSNWSLPFYLETTETVSASEAAARKWRYEALQRIAERENFEAIVTGHTASDRAETLLFNLIRGSGADGLQSLNWTRWLGSSLTLVRPMLDITRTETAQFCREMNLEIWEDSTNQDLKYARNRIRHELLPYLKATFNSQVEQHLAQTIELFSAEVAYLEAQATELRQTATNALSLDRLILRQAPLALQRRSIRQFLQKSLGIAANFEQVEKVVALINAPNRSRTDPIRGNTIAEVDGDWIRLNVQTHGRLQADSAAE